MYHPFKPYREDRKRRFSEMEQVYCGPEEFMEAGVRGFLVTTLPDKEEFAIDDAIDLLRQTSIKLYGGIKPKLKKPEASKGCRGYVRIDFMDPDDVTLLPIPEGEAESEEELDNKEDNKEEGKEEEGKEEEQEKKDKEGAEESTMDTDKAETKAEKKDTETKKTEEDDEMTEDAEKQGDDAEKKDAKDTETKEGEDDAKKSKKRKPLVYMRSSQKFKAFRTELRSILFVKSNVADPMAFAKATMDLLLERKTVAGDSVVQVLPVLGISHYDLQQLEIMIQRVLQPMFDESLPPKSFNVMVFDKISEPGSDLIAETVRNAIWCMNPASWMASPLTEPDYVIRVELIGSKLVLCCMPHFIKYRQYCPRVLVELLEGEPEDDDGTDMNAEMKEEYEIVKEKERQRKAEWEEKKKREEEERKKLAEERRKQDEERRKKNQEDKKKKEEERKKREEESKKRREERKKKEAEKKKAEDEKIKKNNEENEQDGAEQEVKDDTVETAQQEGGDDAKKETKSKDSKELDVSQNNSLDESDAKDVDAEMASDEEGAVTKAKKPRGRRGKRAGARTKK